MRKLFLMTIVVLSALAALVAFATEVPENITIDACADTKAAVEFPHSAHFELAACVDCHHTSEGLTAETVADMTVATCASCHVEPEAAEVFHHRLLGRHARRDPSGVRDHHIPDDPAVKQAAEFHLAPGRHGC